MKILKPLLIAFIFITVIFGVIYLFIFQDPINLHREVEVNQLNKDTVICLTKQPQQGSIHALDLEINGKINGKVIFIQAFSKTSFYITDTLTNEIKLSNSGDWYQDTCYILFKPVNCKRGSLKIKYRFIGTNNYYNNKPSP